MFSSQARLLTVALLVVFLSTTALVSAHDHYHHHHDDDDDDGMTFDWDFGDGSTSQDFKQCFCWNRTSSTFCNNGGSQYISHSGEVQFWRPSCNRLVSRAYWWIVFVVLALVFLFLFPFFFLAARLCCNCCGGRKPSYGCCCPMKTTHPRRYPKSTTRLAKFLALCVLGFAVGSAVVCFHGVHKSVQATENTAQAVGDAMSGFDTTLTNAVTSMLALSSQGYAYPTATEAAAVQQAYDTAHPSLETAQKHVIPEIEHWQTQGHPAEGYAVPGIPLTFVAIVTLLAILNVRGAAISISAGIVSILSGVMLLLGALVLAAAATSNIACNNWSDAIPFTVALLQDNDVCGTSQTVSPLNGTMAAYMQDLCVNKTLAYYCEQNGCQTNVCAAPFQASHQWIISMAEVEKTLTGPTVVRQSVKACVESNTTCSMSLEASRIWDLYMLTKGQLMTIESSLRNLNQCSQLQVAMNTSLYSAVCVDHRHGDSSLTSSLFSLGSNLMGFAGVLFVAIWVWIYGAKRFTKPGTPDSCLCENCQSPRAEAENMVQYHPPYGLYGTPAQPLLEDPQTGVVYSVNQPPHQSIPIPAEEQQQAAGFDPVIKPNNTTV